MSQYFIHNRTDNIKCLNGEILHLSTKWAHFKFDACYRSQKLARGQQRAEKAIHFEKIQLGEHLATN